MYMIHVRHFATGHIDAYQYVSIYYIIFELAVKHLQLVTCLLWFYMHTALFVYTMTHISRLNHIPNTLTSIQIVYLFPFINLVLHHSSWLKVPRRDVLILYWPFQGHDYKLNSTEFPHTYKHFPVHRFLNASPRYYRYAFKCHSHYMVT